MVEAHQAPRAAVRRDTLSIREALTILEAEDLITLTETKVWAASSVRHIDELGMIGV
jgi:hypothetical protein